MEKIIKLEDYTMEEIQTFSGPNEEHLALLEDEFHVDLVIRGDELHISESNEQLEKVIHRLLEMTKKHVRISTKDIMYTIGLSKTSSLDEMDQLYTLKIARTVTGKVITPKTIGQKEYYYALKDHDVVFAIGPAGTGKTYMAVVFAVQALKNNQVKKIILTRPAVEAGEIDPYLRPLYDALYDMLGQETTERMIEKGIIEIAPLAYMRGRTLEDAYVILDEAQNTTDNQMKMFLTRLGFNSKMIVTGDITQIDLPHGVRSGLRRAVALLKGVKGIKFVFLSATDVVRHPVVARIIRRYEEAEKEERRDQE